jgi:hypothetical protein
MLLIRIININMEIKIIDKVIKIYFNKTWYL